MNYRTLNTFSKQVAEGYQRSSNGRVKIEQTIQVRMLSVNDIIASHFASSPDFVSCDIEGLDLAVLMTLDFSRFRPAVFCIESPRDNAELINLMSASQYSLYAHTAANLIFIAEEESKAIKDL